MSKRTGLPKAAVLMLSATMILESTPKRTALLYGAELKNITP